MAFKEYDNGIYTKEQNDPVITYLKNIIQRYFQIENEITKETKESIIIQAFTRLKEVLNAYSEEYILCINEKSGAIDLNISDIKDANGIYGESSFKKNNAFNKDFCSVTSETKTLYNHTTIEYNNYGNEEVDHIVSGDDDRLFDARIPLAHIHNIEEIRNLKQYLEELENDGSLHGHDNLKVLNMIRYTGSRVTIDLIILEYLQEKVKNSLDTLKEQEEYFMNTYKRYINQLNDILVPLWNRLDSIKLELDSWITNWTDDAKLYAEINDKRYRNVLSELIKQYLSKEEYDALKEIYENAVKFKTEGTFAIGEDDFELDATYPHLTEEHNYTFSINTKYKIKEGCTSIQLSGATNYHVPNTDLTDIYDNNLNNAEVKLFLEYTKDGISHRDELPYVYQVNGSKHDSILVYGTTNSENDIEIHYKRISEVPVYLTHDIIVGYLTEDAAGLQSGTSYIIISEDDDIDHPVQVTNEQNNLAHIYDAHTLVDLPEGDMLSVTVQEQFDEDDKDDLRNRNVLNPIYYKKCKISWNVAFNPELYTYKLWKRINGEGEWIDLMPAKSFSSDNPEVLQEIYSEGKMYSCYNDEDYDIRGNTNFWHINEDNCIETNSNSTQYDILLTNDIYGTYRHVCTFTVSTNTGPQMALGDDDLIGTIISAVEKNGRIHTLSLVCQPKNGGGGGGIINDGSSQIILIYNLRQAAVSSSSHTTVLDDAQISGPSLSPIDPTRYTWRVTTKVSLDIRKDHENLIIYSSNFYEDPSYTYADYDNTKIDYTSPKISTTFADIEAATGIDFSEGYVGYGALSQEKATIVGINFQTYNTYKQLEFIDDIIDEKVPYDPSLTGYCKNKLITKRGMVWNDFVIESHPSDYYEQVEYKIQLYQDVNWSNDDLSTAEIKLEPVVESDPMLVTTFSGGGFTFDDYTYTTSREMEQTIVSNYGGTIHPEEITSANPNLYYEDGRIASEAGGVLARLVPSFNHKLVFADNVHYMKHDEAEDYYYDYNCVLFDDTEENINNAIALMNMQMGAARSEYGLMYRISGKNGDKSRFLTEKQGIIYIDESVNVQHNNMFEYNFCSLRDFLPDATIRYQIIEVPGKGESDA